MSHPLEVSGKNPVWQLDKSFSILNHCSEDSLEPEILSSDTQGIQDPALDGCNLYASSIFTKECRLLIKDELHFLSNGYFLNLFDCCSGLTFHGIAWNDPMNYLWLSGHWAGKPVSVMYQFKLQVGLSWLNCPPYTKQLKEIYICQYTSQRNIPLSVCDRLTMLSIHVYSGHFRVKNCMYPGSDTLYLWKLRAGEQQQKRICLHIGGATGTAPFCPIFFTFLLHSFCVLPAPHAELPALLYCFQGWIYAVLCSWFLSFYGCVLKRYVVVRCLKSSRSERWDFKKKTL